MNFNKAPKKETEKTILFTGDCTCKKEPKDDTALDDIFHIGEKYQYQLIKYRASYWYRIRFGKEMFSRCDMAIFDQYFDHITANKENS